MASSSAEEESTSSSTTFVSRRRLAFRPPAPPQQPKQLTSAESQAAIALISLDGNETTIENVNTSQDEAARRKAAKSWTHEDIMAYYEALKIHGKDFDSVAKLLSKRKIMKDKDQIKNYFYNSLKILKQLLAIEEDDMGDIPKDAKELFLALNACEWKKRTNNGKFVSDRLKELLFDGVTNIRLNKKTVQIKTPPCPSLVRWFSRSRRIDKMPSEVTIILKPKSNGDASFLRSNLQNPFLKIKININDKVSKLIELLQKKWRKAGDEEDENFNLKVRVWPSFVTDVGSLSVVETEGSPFVALSLNKLRKENDEMNAQKKNPINNTSTITLASDNINVKSSYTVLYPRPFTLTDEKIKAGLSTDNVENIIVAELYCTCGMTDNIELRYEIETNHRNESPYRIEPWKVMIEMLTRDYGEALCAKKDDIESQSATKRKEKEANEDSNHSLEYEPPLKRGARMLSQIEMPSTSTKFAHQNNSAAEVIPHVLQVEIDEFENQVQCLKKKMFRKTKKSTKHVEKPSTSAFNRLVASFGGAGGNGVGGGQNAQQAPICEMIPKNAKNLNTPVYFDQQKNKFGVLTPTKEEMSRQQLIKTSRGEKKKIVAESPKTDFSDFVITPVKNDQKEELQKARTESFLTSLKTPSKTPKKTAMEELFGGELSMSPTATRKSFSSGSNNLEDETSRCELTDILFGEISSTPTKYSSYHGNSQGNALGLGFSDSEVQQSYVDMITSSQDSRDFVMQHFKRVQKKN